MLRELINLANHLDRIGMVKESDYLDILIKKASPADFNPGPHEIKMRKIVEKYYKDKGLLEESEAAKDDSELILDKWKPKAEPILETKGGEGQFLEIARSLGADPFSSEMYSQRIKGVKNKLDSYDQAMNIDNLDQFSQVISKENISEKEMTNFLNRFTGFDLSVNSIDDMGYKNSGLTIDVTINTEEFNPQSSQLFYYRGLFQTDPLIGNRIRREPGDIQLLFRIYGDALTGIDKRFKIAMDMSSKYILGYFEYTLDQDIDEDENLELDEKIEDILNSHNAELQGFAPDYDEDLMKFSFNFEANLPLDLNSMFGEIIKLLEQKG